MGAQKLLRSPEGLVGELLRTHRTQLDKLAAALLTDEVLEREEIDRIMAGTTVTAPDRRAGIHLGLAAASTETPPPPPGAE